MKVIDYCFVLFVCVGIQEFRQVWDSNRVRAERPWSRQPSALSICVIWISGVHGCRRTGASVAFRFLLFHVFFAYIVSPERRLMAHARVQERRIRCRVNFFFASLHH